MEITNDNIGDLINNKKVVLIDIWAAWCGPCKTLSPIVDTIQEEYFFNENVTIGKVNVDEHRDIALKYDVRSIPALLYFKDGEVVHKTLGVQTKESIISKLEELSA